MSRPPAFFLMTGLARLTDSCRTEAVEQSRMYQGTWARRRGQRCASSARGIWPSAWQWSARWPGADWAPQLRLQGHRPPIAVRLAHACWSWTNYPRWLEPDRETISSASPAAVESRPVCSCAATGYHPVRPCGLVASCGYPLGQAVHLPTRLLLSNPRQQRVRARLTQRASRQARGLAASPL